MGLRSLSKISGALSPLSLGPNPGILPAKVYSFSRFWMVSHDAYIGRTLQRLSRCNSCQSDNSLSEPNFQDPDHRRARGSQHRHHAKTHIPLSPIQAPSLSPHVRIWRRFHGTFDAVLKGKRYWHCVDRQCAERSPRGPGIMMRHQPPFPPYLHHLPHSLSFVRFLLSLPVPYYYPLSRHHLLR